MYDIISQSRETTSLLTFVRSNQVKRPIFNEFLILSFMVQRITCHTYIFKLLNHDFVECREWALSIRPILFNPHISFASLLSCLIVSSFHPKTTTYRRKLCLQLSNPLEVCLLKVDDVAIEASQQQSCCYTLLPGKSLKVRSQIPNGFSKSATLCYTSSFDPR